MISVTSNTDVLLQMSAVVRCDMVTVQINLDHFLHSCIRHVFALYKALSLLLLALKFVETDV